MKVFNINTGKQVNDYVGCWYDLQVLPQNIYLHIDGRSQDVWIEEDRNIGGGYSPDVFHNLELRILLPGKLYSENETENLLFRFQDGITKVLESFHEEFNGNNYVGVWDCDDVDDLKFEINDYEYNSELVFECDFYQDC